MDLATFAQIIWLIYSVYAFLNGIYYAIKKNNPYGNCRKFYLLGAFVNADSVVFGAFFVLATTITLLMDNFVLFLLIISVFWTVRSIGEQMYWFLEQFAHTHRNPEHTMWFSKFFKRNSSWIAMQIFWQCISVIAIITTVLLFSKLI